MQSPRCTDTYNGDTCERWEDHKGQHWARGGDRHWASSEAVPVAVDVPTCDTCGRPSANPSGQCAICAIAYPAADAVPTTPLQRRLAALRQAAVR